MKNYNIERDKAIFLFIDLQDKLLKAIFNREELIKKAKVLAEMSNIMNMPSLMTAQYPKGLGFTTKEIKSEIENSKEIEKISFSCMLNEEFKEYLKKTGKKQVIISGVEAHICVLLTARDLLKEGYEVFIAADAVGSRSDFNYRNALGQLEDMGCVVTNVETIMFDLNSVAGTDEFKSVQKLII
ncbi:MAG: isochorismatase family protein [Peptoniphilaceae bacterium]